MTIVAALLAVACTSEPMPAAPAPSTPPPAQDPAAGPADPSTPVQGGAALPTTAADTDAAVYGLVGVDYACAPCQGLDLANLDEVRVSSHLKGEQRYSGSRALDGKLDTAWCEGADGTGVGETMRIRLRKPMFLDAVGMYGGYFKDEALLAKNGRIRAVRLTTSDGVDQILRFADPTVPLDHDPSVSPDSEPYTIAPGEWFSRMGRGEVPRHTVAGPVGGGEAQPITWLNLEILEVWPGTEYEDTCLSEVDLLFVDPAEL